MKRSVKTLKNIIADEVFDVSNYPSCKSFLPITESNGNEFTEIVGGDILTMSGLVAGGVSHGTNYISNDDLVAASSAAGELVNAPQILNTKDIVFLVVADFTADNKGVTFGGSASNAQLEIKRKTTAANKFKDDSGSEQLLGSALLDANSQAAAMYMDRSNVKLSLFETDGEAVVSTTLVTQTAGLGSYNFSTANAIASFSSGVNLYGMAVFAFDTLPTDLNAALSWMNYQWRQGNKVIYPAWKNRV